MNDDDDIIESVETIDYYDDKESPSDEDFRKLCIDILTDKVFGTWNIHPTDTSLIGSIFMPLLLLDPLTRKAARMENAVHFYEFMDKAGPRAINGYPIFMSFLTIYRKDAERFSRIFAETEKKYNEFINPTTSEA